MFENIIEWLTPQRVENIALATIGAIIGTFGGAYAGARAADRIATRKAQRTELLARITECNAAIALSFAVCSRALNYKRQFVREMYGQFMLRREAVGAHIAAAEAGVAPQPLPIELNLRTFETFQAPVGRLEAVVLEKVGLRGRPMQLAIQLAECVPSLNDVVAKRNRLVTEWRHSDDPNVIRIMYGFPVGEVHDTDMLDAVEGIMRRTDDCIWFSRTLHDDLIAYAKGLRSSYKKSWRGALPSLDRAYLHRAEADNLFPDEARFAHWQTAFVDKVPRTKGRLFRRLGYWILRDARYVAATFGLRLYLNPTAWKG